MRIEEIEIKTNYDTIFVLSRFYGVACNELTNLDSRAGKSVLTILKSLDVIFQKKLLLKKQKQNLIKVTVFSSTYIAAFYNKSSTIFSSL